MDAAEDSTPTETVQLDLIDSERWIPLSPDDPEPFSMYRTPETGEDCADLATRPEQFGIEVDTEACGFVTMSQPLLHDLEVGEPVTVIAWHSVLQSAEPAMGHIALAIDEEVLWEDASRIPGPARAWNETFASPISASAGSTVYFHVRNHGANTWTLLSISAEKER